MKFFAQMQESMKRFQYWRLCYRFTGRGYLRSSGWFKSIVEQAPVDGQGRPLPWLTYAAIHFLENRVPPFS